MNPRLLEVINAGGQVVTAGRRQARQIRFRYARYQERRSVATWETPRALAWDDWLTSLARAVMWSGYSSPKGQRKLLSPFQEQVLWEQLIQARSDEWRFDNLTGTARKARHAWTLVQSWRLPDPATAQFPNSDVRTFSRWMRAYFSRCRENAWLDFARLSDSIAPALRSGACEPPATVALLGFDRFTPQQRVLLKTLENLGTVIVQINPERQDGEVLRTQFVDQNAELSAAARWVRHILDEDPGAHAAVLVPGLREKRATIERIFDDALMPGSALPGSALTGRPYNISIAPPFARHALVESALRIAQLATGRCDGALFSALLRSPFIRGGQAELALRARFDLWLRAQNVIEVPLARIQKLFGWFKQHAGMGMDATVIETTLHAWGPLLERSRTVQQPSAWAELFRDWLDSCGWPGDFGLNSAEHQTVERFRDLMHEFASLDFLTTAMNAHGALTMLSRLAKRVEFQPRTPEVSVQILEPAQAYGLSFDRLWLSGFHNEAWPPSPDPNPFIPLEWQRQYALPNSTAQETLAFAQRLTAQLLHSTDEVVVSAPAQIEDRSVPISPLVQHLQTIRPQDLRLADLTDYRAALRAATDLETLDDELAPPLAGAELTRGGSTVFRLQAACPFRAFSELRLGATPLSAVAPGLDPLARGRLLHAVLEHTWKQLESHEVLAEVIDSGHLEAQVAEIVERALRQFDRGRVVALTPRFRELEHQRLVRLVVEWLRSERQREPFIVQSTEQERTASVGGLEVRVRTDRVDRIGDHGLAIIDYKAGSHGPAEWCGPRPDEPQLPLYAVTGDDQLSALMFGVVRAGRNEYKGISRVEAIVPGLKTIDHDKWNAQLTGWRNDLAALADHYKKGDARVDPKSAKSCRQCHLSTLCRINEGRSLLVSEDG